MNKGKKRILILILVIIVVIAVVGFIFGKNGEISLNNKNNANTNTGISKIDDNVLEISVKKALIEIVNDEYYKNVSDKEGTIGAEGNKILGAEIKDNQIYAYVVAEYGVYKLENGEITPVSAIATPITLIFDFDDEAENYKMTKYLTPSDAGDDAWLSSLKEIFPADLIDSAKSVNYKEDFYQEQIKSYVNPLKNSNTTTVNTETDTKQLLLDVMNNKKKFIDEDNNEVFLKDFKIVELV